MTTIETSDSQGYEYDYGYLAVPVGTLYTLAWWLTSQATPGKRAIGARIVDARTGGKPTAAQFLLRYAGYLVSGLPFGLGYVWAAFDRRKQGWHDKIAGTVVVHARGGRRDDESTRRKEGGDGVAPSEAVRRPRTIAGIVVVATLLGVALPVVGVFVATNVMLRWSEPHRLALARLERHPGALEALGAPVSPGRLVSGSIEVAGSSGEAELGIPVAGTRRSGTVYVKAGKERGSWTLERVVLELDGGERLDLGAGEVGPSASHLSRQEHARRVRFRRVAGEGRRLTAPGRDACGPSNWGLSPGCAWPRSAAAWAPFR